MANETESRTVAIDFVRNLTDRTERTLDFIDELFSLAFEDFKPIFKSDAEHHAMRSVFIDGALFALAHPEWIRELFAEMHVPEAQMPADLMEIAKHWIETGEGPNGE